MVKMPTAGELLVTETPDKRREVRERAQGSPGDGDERVSECSSNRRLEPVGKDDDGGEGRSWFWRAFGGTP
ncbi:uncharacterized protein BO96DRAFT_438853 [Aspergillus niger CBS 101883]|uniref:Uncharacterized protein n=2 Tax=Aspergillus niger TaxID=5061 RepID=A2QXY8_ASPNC|nr:uncharacterized protein BO96DRAFT_438853 [Aspergillus niger CBS 101883]XP_059601691.1 hypothetical protein An11g10700 [Aspergillus niger]PYH51603.1 hypothetical protein BO96DRAFT_438853 [Aspergillus niger CBS 101883]CAK40868.1 hypothetical protein An11g10700 [Aspergillus niger]